METRVRWWQAALLLTLSAGVVVLVLELTARTLSWRMGKGFWSRPHSFESAFFVTYDWPPPLIHGDRGTFRTGQSVRRTKAPGEWRVVCLGGSTTVNARNLEGLTYTREVQAALRQRFPERRLWVLNAGADAFSSAHSLTNLALRVLDFEPDVVTVLHNINDLSARRFGDRMLPDYSNKYLDDAFLAYEHRGGVGGAVFRVSRGAQMLKWRLSTLKRMLERSSRGHGVRDPERGAALFERNLRSIVAVTRAHGARPLLITQAHADGEARAEDGAFRRYNDVVRRLGAETATPVVDLGASLSGRAELFLDPVHLTAEGVRAIARELEPALAAVLESGEGAD